MSQNLLRQKSDRILQAARAALSAAVEDLTGVAPDDDKSEPCVLLALGMAAVHAGRVGERLGAVEIIEMFARCLNMSTEYQAMNGGLLPLGSANVTPRGSVPDVPCAFCGIVNSVHDRNGGGTVHWRTETGEPCPVKAPGGHSWKSGRESYQSSDLANKLRATAIRSGASPSDTVFAIGLLLIDMTETNSTGSPEEAFAQVLTVLRNMFHETRERTPSP